MKMLTFMSGFLCWESFNILLSNFLFLDEKYTFEFFSSLVILS